MKLSTITIIKDILAILLIALILIKPEINNWWTILGILILSGNYAPKE